MSAQSEEESPVRILSFGGVCTWKTVATTSTANKKNAPPSSSSSADLCAICRAEISDLCVECATKSAHGTTSSAVETISSGGNISGSSTAASGETGNENNIQPAAAAAADLAVISSCHITVGENCGHSFHVHCLNGWLKSHETCPLCSDPWKPVPAVLDRSALVVAP